MRDSSQDKHFFAMSPRPDQAPAGPRAQSGVRGSRGLSKPLHLLTWESFCQSVCLFFSFFSSLFLFFLFQLLLSFFYSEVSSRCGAPLCAGPWAQAQKAHRLIRHRVSGFLVFGFRMNFYFVVFLWRTWGHSVDKGRNFVNISRPFVSS